MAKDFLTECTGGNKVENISKCNKVIMTLKVSSGVEKSIGSPTLFFPFTS